MSIRICLFFTDFNPTITLLNPRCFRCAVSRVKPPCSSKSLAIRVLMCTFRSFSRRSLFPRSLSIQILVRIRNITLTLLFSHVQFFLQGRSKNYGCKLYSGFVSNWIFSNNACPLTCNLFSPLWTFGFFPYTVLTQLTQKDSCSFLQDLSADWGFCVCQAVSHIWLPTSLVWIFV